VTRPLINVTGAIHLAAIFSTHTLDHLLSQFGYAAVFVFVMVESLGVPFPGETMVISAAVYAGATQHLSVWLIWASAAAGAIVGGNIGYGLGYWGGYRLLRRYGGRVHVDEKKLKVGRLLFERQGDKVVFFGRFVSVLRTYVGFLAGVNRMEWRRFFVFNAAGAVLWSGICSLGMYYAGDTLKRFRGQLDVALGVVAAAVIVASILWTRRHAKRLEEEAERAYPGPLEDDTVKTGASARDARAPT
jgi:membrane protein DedA with SNARE-associated domain